MLLVGINAKYVHSNLAIRYLSRIDSGCSFCEFTIADRPEQIAAAIFESGKKDIFFSCYIWNIEHVLRTCEILKKADDSFRLGLAGPEVSFDAEGILEAHTYLDFIWCGEGEPSVCAMADALHSGAFDTVPGLYYKEGGDVTKSPIEPMEAAMDDLPFPYTDEDMETLKGRLVYFETSRGCPYRCAFCLSGRAGSLRFMSVEKVKEAICFFAKHKVPLVKLVDRTFNADPKRALSIINSIKEQGGGTSYHFEIRAESMTEELIAALASAPKGMFQLEIGVQSTNPETLTRINRRPAFDKLSEVVRALSQNQNMHMHLDLIAGLPKDTMETFIKSFNRVIGLRPHNLQLGFLKKLKGADLETAGSAFWEAPPYEVIHSDAMSYADILRLKRVEDLLEKYYNSGKFYKTMAYVFEHHYPNREFDFFDDLANFYREKGEPKGNKALYESLYLFGKEKGYDETFTYAIIFDYCLYHRDSLSFMEQGDKLKNQAFEFLKKPERVALYFADYAGEKPVNLYKQIRFVTIGKSVFAFDYAKTEARDVTKEFE